MRAVGTGIKPVRLMDGGVVKIVGVGVGGGTPAAQVGRSTVSSPVGSGAEPQKLCYYILKS